ncbi:MAG: aldo/keto reductase [Candidatus Ornithospirochaeta sp.]|nr:aldo/keto reductase [Candidatus Ornithospirochaeta sp.]
MNPKKLGFGLMRLPLKDPARLDSIDYDALCQMVDEYMDAGFSYFDTAVPYHARRNSEIAFRECVSKRYPRSSYTITNKLSFSMIKREDELEDFFADQLECCGVEYFDYYLLHAMKSEYIELADRIHAYDFIRRKMDEGRIRHIGFSFHDTADVLDGYLAKHPEMEYVQLQINYADWDSFEVQSRLCYETAVKHSKRVLVMEPVKGGLLVNLPEKGLKALRDADPDASPASWALRFAASLGNVDMVLSGMSSLEQIRDNIRTMSEFRPLSDQERLAIDKAAQAIKEKESIGCTACCYCVESCPRKIGIPYYFKLMNDISKFGESQRKRAENRYKYYTESEGRGKASSCVKCGKCEEQCPQHLPIRKLLEDTAKELEK